MSQISEPKAMKTDLSLENASIFFKFIENGNSWQFGDQNLLIHAQILLCSLFSSTYLDRFGMPAMFKLRFWFHLGKPVNQINITLDIWITIHNYTGLPQFGVLTCLPIFNYKILQVVICQIIWHHAALAENSVPQTP
jgi:hypothetical protein